jgi:hypothetical protein
MEKKINRIEARREIVKATFYLDYNRFLQPESGVARVVLKKRPKCSKKYQNLSVVLFFPQLRNFAQSGHTAPI